MELVIWLLLLAGGYLLVAAGYRLLLSIRALRSGVAETRRQLEDFGPDPVTVSKAVPSTANDLPKLLFDRRARSIAKERAREQRRRRLINRISSIDIDKRSA